MSFTITIIVVCCRVIEITTGDDDDGAGNVLMIPSSPSPPPPASPGLAQFDATCTITRGLATWRHIDFYDESRVGGRGTSARCEFHLVILVKTRIDFFSRSILYIIITEPNGKGENSASLFQMTMMTSLGAAGRTAGLKWIFSWDLLPDTVTPGVDFF